MAGPTSMLLEHCTTRGDGHNADLDVGPENGNDDACPLCMTSGCVFGSGRSALDSLMEPAIPNLVRRQKCTRYEPDR